MCPVLFQWRHILTLLARHFERTFSFFLWGDPVQNRPENPALGVFSTRKSRSEVPERQDLGEENCLEKAGVDRVKEGKKDAQKKAVFLGVKFGSL